MKPTMLILALIVAACTAGETHDTSKTTTDTVVTPVKTNDTAVVEKKVDVKTDTVKKTHHKP